MARRCDQHAEPLTGVVRPLRADGHHDTVQLDFAALAEGEHFVDRSRPARGGWARVARITRRRVVVHLDRMGFAVNIRPNGVDSWAGFSHDADGWLGWLVDGKLAVSWQAGPQ